MPERYGTQVLQLALAILAREAVPPAAYISHELVDGGVDPIGLHTTGSGQRRGGPAAWRMSMASPQSNQDIEQEGGWPRHP